LSDHLISCSPFQLFLLVGVAMAIKVSSVPLWSAGIKDKAGGAAKVLRPLAKARVNLNLVIARRLPKNPGRGLLLAGPIKGARAARAARAAGLKPMGKTVALRVEGANAAGVGHALTRAVAETGVSLREMAATSVGSKYACYVVCDSSKDAKIALRALRSAGRR
jgi:rhodanese-related sulfurtransferase